MASKSSNSESNPSQSCFRGLYDCLQPDTQLSIRVFLSEARLILSKMMWNFDLEMSNPGDWDWMKQSAYLVFEPKALVVKLREKTIA